MNPRERRGRVSRRGRERHISVGLLVVIAVGISAILMGALTAQAVMARASCDNHPLLLNVAVSDDLSPAIQRVGQLFNRQDHIAAGRCVEVRVKEEEPAAVAAAVDGQAPAGGLPAIDAWIPDSSLWTDVARSFPLGAQQVQPTGITVARSPLMIVMPAAAAAQIPAFNNSVGWDFLLPPQVGGPTSTQLVRLNLPDPTQSSAGLAALVEMKRLLGTGQVARTRLTDFVFSAQSSAQFDDPASLAAFVTLASPPLDAHPVTVTTEQAVLSYDAARPGQPLAARYPVGPGAALGDPELDYPYVVTSTNPAEQAAAAEFGKLLRQGYTAGLVRYYGFRSADGTTATLPAASGLAQQTLQLAPPATPSEAQTALQTWEKLQLGSRDLTVMDVSSAMSAPSGLGNLTLEQILTQTALLGLEFFPDSTQMGIWEFADKLSAGAPYKQLVPVGPLPGELGLISRRQQIKQVDLSLHPLNSQAELNQTILAAYQQMVSSYQPNYTNAVLVLTAGVDNGPKDLPVATLVAKLRALFTPNRPVELIIVMLGTKGNFTDMQEIAAAGGGAAYQVTDPAQVGKVFFEAVSRRICLTSGCAVP
ncbi:MAG TPA: substrate-binding domain-containing protein [Streptosporangiaceae bacterium]|nr:substrate-binding domain-containing protein [Streptosporangiaceae bacterium]